MFGKIIKGLFGGGQEQKQPEAVGEEYKGFLIYPLAQNESGQYRVAGRIEKELDGELQSYSFIRSDLCMSAEQANELMLNKSRQFIDQMGDQIFK